MSIPIKFSTCSPYQLVPWDHVLALMPQAICLKAYCDIFSSYSETNQVRTYSTSWEQRTTGPGKLMGLNRSFKEYLVKATLSVN